MKKILFLILLLSPILSFATHLRAGEITTKRIGTSFTYKVTLTTYTDQINGIKANDDQNTVDFYFGYSTSKNEHMRVTRKKKVLITPATMCNVYDTTYTFPGSGIYTISVGILNRNANTVNLPYASGSDQLSFFVQSTIVINPSIGLNTSPVLLNIPIDSAAAGKKFVHNPGAFDADGDSLAFRLTTPMRDVGVETGVGIPIEVYMDPDTVGKAPFLNEAQNGPATFSINPLTGDLTWDCPQLIGQYNVAFIVEEWRKAPDGSHIKIGEVERDMQIIVVQTDNNRPIITVPNDICVEAGESIKFTITATDKDAGQTLHLSSSSGVYNLDASGNATNFISPEIAKFVSKDTLSPVKGTFTWNTNCNHVRDQAYDVLFKVVDFPARFSTQLADIKTMKIKIVPPRATSLFADTVANGIKLTWHPATKCNFTGKQYIYRKNGCSGQNPAACSTGMPSNWGYTLIATLGLTDSVYVDNTTSKGNIYSYRIVNELQVSQFVSMQSAPSAEFCVGTVVTKGTSLMTNVSVISTDTASGKISLTWTRPLGQNLTNIKPPYLYKIYRSVGNTSENYAMIQTVTTDLSGKTADTTFVDTNLNTKNNIYRYKVELYSETSKLVNTTATANSVWLVGSPGNKQINLSWQAATPWNNDNQTHLIYRQDNTGNFNLIAKVKVGNNYSYTDTGVDTEPADGNNTISVQNGSTYCYKIQTVGAYSQYPYFSALINDSQVACATASDNTPPCAPNLVSGSNGCEKLNPADLCIDANFVNNLSWTNPSTNNGTNCRTDIVAYKIYYARYDSDTPTFLTQVDASSKNTYTHKRNLKDGFAGCYYITAVNSLKLEGAVSNKICFDNCEIIAFPNVFTPNGDGLNDTFSPMNCPAFINSISYEIYNNAGLKIAFGSGDSMNWDGKNTAGTDMPSASYYYLVTVNFERLSKSGSTKTFKGWVNLIR